MIVLENGARPVPYSFRSTPWGIVLGLTLLAGCSPLVDYTGATTTDPSTNLGEFALLLFDEGNTRTLASVDIGSTSDSTFTLRNYGTSAATAVTVSLIGTAGEELTLTADLCGGQEIAPEGTCTLTLHFAPAAATVYTGTLSFSYSGAAGTASGELAITAIGTNLSSGGGAGSGGTGGTGGDLSQAYVIISDGTTYDFGSAQKGLSKCKYFSVSNLGTQSASSLQASTSAPLSGAFAYLGGSYPGTGGTCGSSLASDTSCLIRACFTPSATGVQSESIVLDYLSGTNAATAVRDITGNGVAAVQVAAGDTFTCVNLSNGAVKCLGQTGYGAVGNALEHDNEATDPIDNTTGAPVAAYYAGTWADRSTPSAVYRLDGSTTAMSASQISAADLGGAHACAVTQTQEVRCWGSTGGGLGNSSAVSIWNGMPGAVSVIGPDGSTNLSGITQVAAGRYFSCARSAAGRVYCWGSNGYGQVGDTSNSDRNYAVAVSGIDGTAGNTAVDISAGYQHTCAAIDDGSVRCWGRNAYGELGPAIATGLSSNVPLAVTGITTAIQVDAGPYATCAILSDGGLKCWGMSGGLGYDTTGCGSNCSTPTQFGSFDGSTADRTAVSVGIGQTGSYSAACTVAESGKLYCSYFAGYGTYHAAPVEVTGVSDAIAVSMSNGDACFTTSSGAVKCFGWQSNSEYGAGSGSTPTPITISGLVP
jgi:alpha-tubulin suppressor-like RCC1 family protein